MPKKKIVLIGGAKGLSEPLKALVKRNDVALTAVVSMMDDGGSSGIIRRSLKILPPGDIRRALIYSSTKPPEVEEAWEHRFTEGKFEGHVMGNLVIAVMLRDAKDPARVFRTLNRRLKTRADVLPVTVDQATIVATLADGKKIVGETHIDVPAGPRAAIDKIVLKPSPKILPAARKAILSADVILIGPGDLYTSVLPPLLVAGMKEVLQKTKATVVYACNTFTKKGETDGYAAADFIAAVEKHIGAGIIDAMIVNTARPSGVYVELEKAAGRELVKVDKRKIPTRVRLIAGNFIGDKGLYNNGEKYGRVIMAMLNVKS